MENMLVNQVIKNFRVTSFWLNGTLKCNAIVFHIETTAGVWYRLTICDGISHISRDEVEPLVNETVDPADEFSYPINTFESNPAYLNIPIKSVMEYLWDGREDESCGILISFVDGKEFSIIDYEDCLKFVDGIDEQLLEKCVLKNCL